MKNYLLLLFCSVFFILNSCRDQEENTESKTPVTVQLIGKGDLVGNNIPQQNTVITTSAQWNTLLNNLDASNNISGGFTETNVDFNQFMIIATFDQVFPNGGHSIDIIAVDENPQNIIVDVEKLLTGNVTAVVTQPYHIVKIPKSTKPIIFQ
ncbi:protease complex subunit PrcB family protein [Chryseobacterium wangxinyae]|uniref:protease complex subunit PrcB family protein n=1 Tax=Chryseobacterium sp. CY350 TaxID=2997336 RepID=UPI002270156E|nr:protease complex subunit PrcB family protein [Chryseobacterium sp. CY350]MCY0978120.1 protease complex subunit PrcB family protein [Chryseobacterium sp. CY350]WBZ95204.1 protease complex subunit PrcB family protein [Chryseobacterium sp. CY350]